MPCVILPFQVILVTGVATLLVDAFAMGVRDFLSSLAEVKHTKLEQEREMWEIENYLMGEQMEMIQIYKHKGMTHKDAKVLGIC